MVHQLQTILYELMLQMSLQSITTLNPNVPCTTTGIVALRNIYPPCRQRLPHQARSNQDKLWGRDRVVSALQPTWLIGLGRARTRDQPVSRRKGYADRFRGSPPRSSVDALPDLIVLFLPCQVVGDVTPTPCAPPSKGRPLAPAEAYPAARGVRRQGVGHRQQAN